MEKDDEITDVIFRKFLGGEILALFPYIDEGDYRVRDYVHLGQHGAADYMHCISKTKPAKESEYADLKKELEDIGYKLRVIKRRQYRPFVK